MWKKSISLYTYFLLVIIFVGSNFYIKKWENLSVIDWDVITYYDYLPATFIYHDYKMKFVKENTHLAEEHKFWPLVAPNGNYVDKMTMGMSMMYAPFFFLAHIQSQVVESNPNGFSWYYHKYIHLSCLFYLLIGLFFLRKLLLHWFDEWAVSLTLISVTLGTNLFYYASTEAALSHSYNFSLAAIFMYGVHSWFGNKKLRYAICIGITMGLLILIRPINMVFVLFPLLYGLTSFKDVNKNIQLFLSKPSHLIIVIGSAFLVVLPQLLYWKSITGHYLFFSYVGERFFFLRPMILQGMFSFRNGWLLYSPIMFFSFIGIYKLFRQRFHLSIAIITITLLYLYLAFSWWCWWYVGFGNRSMVDLCSLLSIPMAAFYNQVLKLNNIKKWLVLSTFFLLVSLSLFQTLQYKRGLIHFDSMNFKAYMASFGKLYYTDAYKEALQTPDYKKAMNGE